MPLGIGEPMGGAGGARAGTPPPGPILPPSPPTARACHAEFEYRIGTPAPGTTSSLACRTVPDPESGLPVQKPAGQPDVRNSHDVVRMEMESHTNKGGDISEGPLGGTEGAGRHHERRGWIETRAVTPPVEGWDYLRCRLHATPASPTRPEPRRRRVEGSGTEANARKVGVPPPPGTVRPPLKPLLPSSPVPVQPMEMVLVSMFTASTCAKALPQPIVAPVFRAMFASARIFPWNEVVVSRVAELPTFQYTPAPAPVLITLTTEPGEVISVLGIWKTQAALALPRPSRVSVPVKLLTPAGTV